MNSAINWSRKPIYRFPVIALLALGCIALIYWQWFSDTPELANASATEGNNLASTVEPETQNPAKRQVTDTQDLASVSTANTDSSQQVELLALALLSDIHANRNADQIAGQLAVLLNKDNTLLQQLLSRPYASKSEKHLLLDSISYAAGDAINQMLRDHALDVSRSSDYEQSLAGLELLSSLNIDVDSEVTERLLEFGRSSQEPEVLVRVMATLNTKSDAVTEQQTVVEFFNEMTRSNDPTVRVLAIQRLSQWDQEFGTVDTLTSHSFENPDPSVRAFSLQALASQGAIYPEQRAQLFAVINNPLEDSMVKIAAAEALDTLHLDNGDIQTINAALANEDFQLQQR